MRWNQVSTEMGDDSICPPSGHRKNGVCTELLGPSSLASTSKRGYNSVNKARVLAESLHLEAKQVSRSF